MSPGAGIGEVFWTATGTGTEARPTGIEAGRVSSQVGHGGPTYPLPAHADIAIVGAGYTGLAAARALARRGAKALVIEADTAGAGASTRNGGFVLPGYKRELPGLIRQVGFTRALELFEESLHAMTFVESLIAEEA
ncbi:MAG TPA: FAD-dependent oxidoreductase, partial [Gemmatimonadales bacterium]|nr:FAD-dependent oxidoreductase [Gemmatimonadales bacterium]